MWRRSNYDWMFFLTTPMTSTGVEPMTLVSHRLLTPRPLIQTLLFMLISYILERVHSYEGTVYEEWRGVCNMLFSH